MIQRHCSELFFLIGFGYSMTDTYKRYCLIEGDRYNEIFIELRREREGMNFCQWIDSIDTDAGIGEMTFRHFVWYYIKNTVKDRSGLILNYFIDFLLREKYIKLKIFSGELFSVCITDKFRKRLR